MSPLSFPPGQALAVLVPPAAPDGSKGPGAAVKRAAAAAAAQGADPPASDIYKLVKMVMARGFDPCIVFAFSKKEVEALALQMRWK